jgi:hypothetical protein
MARSTVFSYKGREVSTLESQQELNVDAVLMAGSHSAETRS